MPHNCGYVVALKTTASAGGVFSLTKIDGANSSAPERGVELPGTTSGVGALTIYSAHSTATPRLYPVDCKFDAHGMALIDFMYDHAVVPRTVAGPGGILTTNFTYRVKDGTTSTNGTGQLLHFSNVGQTSRMGRHIATPSVPLPRVQDAIDSMVARARQLAAVANSMSRPCLAGIVIV